MRDLVNSTGRRPGPGWLLPLVLLASSGCFLDSSGYGPPPVFDPGPEPRTGAVMCDIPKVPSPETGRCATSTELGFGMSQAQAAVALAEGEQSSVSLDFSDDAESECNGYPRKVEYWGPFPDGYAVCLNCAAQFPVPYGDANAVCVAQCIDLVTHGENEPAEGVEAFCQANARVSTNFDEHTCFDQACSDGGTLRTDFADPRRAQEPVKWIDLDGTAATENDLTKTLGTNNSFDAGAASAQTITHGDGWVEFEAAENDMGHYLGLSKDLGPDLDPTPADIQFGIRLGAGGQVILVEDGVLAGGPIGPYAAGERFRIEVKDNLDGTASLSYFRLLGPCTPGTVCARASIGAASKSASYPLRVDASLGSEGATLVDVTLVRIQ